MRRALMMIAYVIIINSVHSSRVILGREFLDINWNKPEITTRVFLSNLEYSVDPLITISDWPIKPKSHYLSKFAVSSWPVFKRSVINFFSIYKEPDCFYVFEIPESIPSYQLENPFWCRLETSLFSGTDLVANKKNYYYFIYNGVKISGHIKHKLFFYSNIWLGHFAGDMDYARTSKLIDSWTQNSDSGDKIYLDNVTGKISYKGKGNFWSVSIGRGKYQVGNNIGGSIILNDDCNDYGYFSNKFNFRKFSVSFLHATLIPDSTSTDSYKDYTDKYLVIHKFDWTPSHKIHLFFGEEVIYGNRSIDPSYLLPHTLMRPIEHNLRDRDNVLIFLGMNYKPFTRNTLYLNFIFDELSKSKIFTSWWGNKYAVQVGNSSKLNKKIRATFEFTAVRPWIYTHKVLENKFSHDGIGLGFPEGSNLLQVCAELNLQFRNNIDFDVNTSYTRQGSVGNDFSINYESRPGDTAHWLEGDISNTIKAKAVLSWQPLTHHKIKFGCQIEQFDDENTASEFMISYQAFY